MKIRIQMQQRLLKIMKVSFYLFFVVTAFATITQAKDSYGQELLNQRVSIQLANPTIEEAIKRIGEEADVKFMYNPRIFTQQRIGTLKVANEKLSDVLNKVLSPAAITYELGGNTIILKRAADNAKPGEQVTSPNVSKANAPITVKGRVTDEKGEGLPGATVLLKGTSIGTATDIEGNFSLNVPDGNGTLIVSSIGYSTQEIEINNRTTIPDIKLGSDVKSLNEVVVVGYGTQRKKDLTGAVAVVDVQELQSQPTAQVTNQLQGRASGVTVLGSGQPGEAPQVRIRGLNTFGNNQPLYVVDGVPTQNINDINPNDVASMQVLKDAGAASIYGSRAANGVIIITTRRGTGKVKVQYDTYTGMQFPKSGNVWDLLNPQETAQLKFNAIRNSNPNAVINDPLYGSGPTPVLPDYIAPQGAKEGDPSVDPSRYNLNPFYTSVDQYNQFYRITRANKEGTDWFHEIFKPAPMTSHNIAVSGGTPQGNYLFSFNYFNQQGTLSNTYLKRYTIRSNSQYNVRENIRIGENLAFSVTDNPRINALQEGSSIGHAFRQQPIIPVRDIMGNYAGGFGQGLGNALNPVAIQERTANNRGMNNRLFGNMYAEIDFLKDFTARTSFGGEVFMGNFNSFAYPAYENQENTTTNSYTENTFSGYNWTWTNTVQYQHLFNDIHDVRVVVGTEAYQNQGRNVGGTTQNYFSFDPNFTNLSTGAGTPTNYSNRYADALFSLIGRLDYTLKDKYLLGATIRRDGSSRFMNYQYGWFPAISAGWRLSEEDFMQDINWLSDLKIRGGYGIMGNQLNVDPANAYTTYGGNRTSSYYAITGSNSLTQLGFQRNRIGNPNARWEKNINSNIGFDASLWKGKLDITADYYHKEVRDLLYTLELAGTAGQGTPPSVNVARMRNTGVDLAASSSFDITSDLKLNATLTFTTYNNKIVSLAEGIDYFDQEGRRFNGSYIVRNAVGHSIGQFYGYKVDGFWNSQEEINTANAQAQQASGNANAVYQNDVAVGRFRYADINGDGQITDEDRTFIGNPNPDFSYGLNLGATYKQFDFSIFFYGTQGNDIWNNVRWWTDFNANFQGAKSRTALYDSWTPENPNAKAPIQETVGSFSSASVPNSYFVENGSYLRAKNAQLGYTLPAGSLKKLGVERLRVYLQAANLFTITKYSGLDPEIGTTANTNNSAGGSLNQSFSSTTSFGIDEGVYPNQRQFLFGLNVTF
ncbi:TonB-dependent receptor [Telluribacter sp. SYSU D00476]|uniref:TonB-dependent receptor n=1 Tax=Telluribacter sp. SYSU D00476 TaxID=2811430 RepID=UPI001FF68A36|nr:TonB-dependent receptor [Telluribacter sp. SYSU D00476]